MKEVKFDSEYLWGLKFHIIDKHIILKTKENGIFGISFEALPTLIKELKEIMEVWG